MTTTGTACRGILKALSGKLSAAVLGIILFALAITGSYLLVVGPDTQQRERIRPLVESGLSVDGSIKFDERFSDKSYRWPWQENKPYREDEIRFAEMWLNSHIIAELLLDYYYCNSPSYYCLVWLLGNLKRSVSYWGNAVSLAVQGDANNDGVSNYESLLGPDAGVLNTFGPNPVTIYALEKNLSKEDILQLKSWEADGQMDEWEREIVDLVLGHRISEDRIEWIVKNVEPNPATVHALERQLPDDQVKLMEPFGRDNHLVEWEKHIIDHLGELSSVYVDWAIEKAHGKRALTDWEEYFAQCIGELPDFFIEKVLNDGHVYYGEWMQTQFLGRFSREHLEEKGADWICNPDLDDDGFTNEFEVRVSSTDPYACNERYAILVCGDDLPVLWSDQIGAAEEFLTSQPNSSAANIWALESKPYRGFKEENVYRLSGENMTFQNFKRLVGDVGERLGGENIVLFVFAGHGERNHVTFADRVVSYEQINLELSTLEARVVCCIIDACYSGSGIAYLQSDGRIVMTSSGEAEKTYGGTLAYSLFSAMQNGSNDQDNNGYCSISESFYGARVSLEDRFGNHPQLSNATLARAAYLVELYLGEQKS